jgi:hypothetical protein
MPVLSLQWGVLGCAPPPPFPVAQRQQQQFSNGTV